MASRQLATTQAAHAQHEADRRKAAEVAERSPGWTVWSARDGRTRVATRTADQRPPSGDDDTWAATLIADTWTDLGQQLAEQAQHDAERSYEAP